MRRNKLSKMKMPGNSKLNQEEIEMDLDQLGADDEDMGMDYEEEEVSLDNLGTEEEPSPLAEFDDEQLIMEMNKRGLGSEDLEAESSEENMDDLPEIEIS